MPVYAEVHGTTLIRFPYTLGSMMEENPDTNFGPDPALATVFPLTNTAIELGYTLAPVLYLPEPPHDASQIATQDANPTLVNGVWELGWTLRGLTPEETEALKVTRKAAVMVLRDHHIADGMMFQGHPYQTRQQDRENVAGASQLATLWLVNGGDPNTLRWADPNQDFVWIDANNDLQPMSASTVIAFGKALAAFKSDCIFHALTLKQTIDACTTAEQVVAVDINAGWPT